MTLASARQLQTALTMFSDINPGNHGLTVFRVFLVIATNPGTHLREIEGVVTGSSNSALGRHIKRLAADEPGSPPFVAETYDDVDLRIKRLYLTNAGRDLLLRILRAADPSKDPAATDYPTYEELFERRAKGGAR